MNKQKSIIPFFLLIAALMIFGAHTFAQSKKIETIKIKTSAMCTQCKDRIEQGMAFEKGVKDVVLDVESKVVTIKYNTKTTTSDELRKKISRLGYDADEVPANKEAYEKLPACCKKDAPKH